MRKQTTTIKVLLLVEDNRGDARLLREMLNDQVEHSIRMVHVECMAEAEGHLASNEVDVMLLDRPQYPATGSGEGACCPIGAAIGNAVFDATGVRIRQLPLRPNRVKAALKAAASA